VPHISRSLRDVGAKLRNQQDHRDQDAKHHFVAKSPMKGTGFSPYINPGPQTRLQPPRERAFKVFYNQLRA
jgi:hypothetical protein